MTNRQDRAILIRAWNYHAGLKTLGHVSDYAFETGSTPMDLSDRMARVAMIPARTPTSGARCPRGFTATPREGTSTAGPRGTSRCVLIVASPVKISWGRACSLERRVRHGGPPGGS